MTITPVKEDLQETEILLDSPMTPAETEELEAAELQLELAGKDRFEKMLIIGKMLSDIYNKALFRGPDGGQSWETYVKVQLPKRLPEAEGVSTQWADRRRVLVEARQALSARAGGGPSQLPVGTMQAEALQALLPRTRSGNQGTWYPLDREADAAGLVEVWTAACDEAVKQSRANGPTEADIRTARERLRKTLEAAGQIRSQPKHLQGGAGTAASSAARRETSPRTVDVSPAQAAADRKTVQDMARNSQAERQQRVAVADVKEELGRADREAEAEARKYLLSYGDALTNALDAAVKLKRALQYIANSKGTCYLSELRDHPGIIGVNMVASDIETMSRIATLLVESRQLAMSNEPPLAVDPETFTTEVV